MVNKNVKGILKTISLKKTIKKGIQLTTSINEQPNITKYLGNHITSN